MDSRYKIKDELLMLMILDAEKFHVRSLSRKAKYDHFDYWKDEIYYIKRFQFDLKKI